MRRTKVIFTFGPSCHTENKLAKLAHLADGIRLNFSHGNIESKRKVVKFIRKLEKDYNHHISIIGDLQGSSIRLGDIGEIKIVRGRKYTFGLKEGIIVPYKKVFDRIGVDDIVLVDDGRFRFRVTKVLNNSFIAIAEESGILSSRKTFLIKNKDIKLPSLTSKDINDLKFAINIGMDYIALSFVRSGNDVKKLNKYIKEFGGDQWVLAKIEHPAAIENIDNILSHADGIIVARGDLGLYYNLEEIPKLQKELVSKSVKMGKITILATQILESMRYSLQPTRSEVSDIYKAVEDGVDAVLLTGETAIGKYPVEAVSWAIKILEEADKYSISRFEGEAETIYDKFAKGVLMMSEVIGGRLIGYSRDGNTARRISRYKPTHIVYIVTPRIEIARKINILYGIKSIVSEDDYEGAFKYAVNYLKQQGILKAGDIIVYTLGIREKATDMVRVEFVR